VAHQLLSRGTVEKLESYFAEDNARFARSYFGRDILFDNLHFNVDTPRISGTEPTLSDIIETIGGLLVRFDERLAALERRVKTIVGPEQD
jgi:hypothetical protein